MKRKSVTTEDLAQMVKAGFDEAQQQFGEIRRDFSTKIDFKVLMEEIRLIKSDIKDIKLTNDSLVQIVAIHDRDIREIKKELEMV